MSPASDRHTSIRSIRYNVLNLPYRVIYEGLVLQQPESRTIYDATGHCHAQLTGYTSYGRFSGDVKLYAGDYIVINDTIDRLLTPYGYLRDGVFHSYVHDYQGNIMCVVTEDEVLQTNLYYPDGLPMTISTQPEANPFKYTGKELSLFRGHPVYDFTARHTLPALGNIFRTIDPKAGDFTSFSPYTFCGGDPINRTDPTGMKWDSDIVEKLEKIKQKISNRKDENNKEINQINESLSKGDIDDKKKKELNSQIDDLNDRIALLNKSLADIENLGKDTNIYTIRKVDKGEKCYVMKNNDKITIYYYDDAIGTFGHEVRHIGQYLDEGKDFRFEDGKLRYPSNLLLKETESEIECYKIQFSITPNNMPGTTNISKLNHITPEWVGNLRDKNTNKILYRGINDFMKSNEYKILKK